MNACDQAPLILPKMQDQISLTLCWRSVDNDFQDMVGCVSMRGLHVKAANTAVVLKWYVSAMRLMTLDDNSLSALVTGESFPSHLQCTLACTATTLNSTYCNIPVSTVYKNRTLSTSQILQYQISHTIQFHSVYSLLFPFWQRVYNNVPLHTLYLKVCSSSLTQQSTQANYSVSYI